MDDIWNTERKQEDDFYEILGCDELSTAEQINAEYKAQVLGVHPDKHPDDPRAVEKFQKLQKARDTLTDKKLREEYDLWRRSGLTVPYEMWRSMKGSIHTTMHWAVREKKEPMIECGSQMRASTSSQTAAMDSADDGGNHPTIPSGWSRKTGDDALHKFRTYQI